MSISETAQWLKTAQGRYVISWEQEKINALVANRFGYNALQLGWPEIDFLAQSRISLHQTVGKTGSVAVLCDFNEMPFAPNSIDLIVMPHILEFEDNPHQVLREVERILVPDGEIIISSFNPISIWGLRHRLRRQPRRFPDQGRYISVLRLRDWLQLLSFEVDRGHFGCYGPLIGSSFTPRFIEKAGDRWWSFAGGVYILRATKRVRGMRVILPGAKWSPQAARPRQLKPVTRKES